MKVTPRLPLHGPHSPHPSYLEMRYFRFSQESAVAAILFAFLEEASLPQNYVLRQSLVDQFGKCSVMSTRVIEFMMDWKIQEKWVLAAWNGEGGRFYEKVHQAFAEITHSEAAYRDAIISELMQLFHVDIVAYPDEYSGSPDRIPICIASYGNSAALYYPNRSMDSFLVMPICKHVHVKAEVFARARELMQAPMTVDMFRRKGLRCSSACSLDVADFVFSEGAKAANVITGEDMTSIATYLSSSLDTFEQYQRKLFSVVANLCVFCRQQCDKSLCLRDCSVCAQCEAMAYFTRLQLICLKCGDPVRSDCWGVIFTAVRRISVEAKGIICECCERYRLISEFTTGSVCDYCSAILQNSPALERLQSQEANVDSSPMSESTKIQLCGGQCNKSKQKKQFSYAQQMSHNRNCWICDDCYYVSLTTQRVGNACSQCGVTYTTGDKVYLNDLRKRLLKHQPETQPEIRVPQACRICRVTYQTPKWSIFNGKSHKCYVCDDCYLLFSREVNSLVCPVCCVQFGKAEDALLRRAESNMSQDLAANVPRLCNLCRTKKYPIIAWKKLEKLEHKCQVCDICLYQSPMTRLKCPSCQRGYSEADKSFLNAIHNRIKKPLQSYSVLFFEDIL